MHLLAQAELLDTLDRFLKTTGFHGMGYVLIGAGVLAIIVVGCWVLNFFRVYLPQVAQAHINFVNKAAANEERATKALETLSSTATNSDDNHARTHTALAHAITAAETHVRRHKDHGTDVIVHLQNAKKALDKE